MDALTDIEIKADDDHDSAVSSPLQQLDSSTSSPLQRVESVAGSPSEDRADSLEYSTDDVSATAVHVNPMQIYTLQDFNIANGLLEIKKVINDGNRSITSIEDENTYQTWHDKDRARDLFESSGSSLNTSLSSDDHQLSKNSRDLSFTPSRGSPVKSVADATTPVSPISEPSGVDHAYRLPRPLLMFSPGLSPIHSKAYVRSQDDRRGRAASVAEEEEEGVEVHSIPSRPLNRSMTSKDGLIIIPVSSSVDGNAPDTPISNFWRNRFFGNEAKDRRRRRSYRSFDSSPSTSKQHSYSEVMRMPLLDDLPDTINSSPSSADESFNTADTDLQLDRQSLIYPTTHSLYQASNHNNSTSSIDGRDIASMKPAMIRADRRQDESISTVDTDLRIDQKSLVYPTTPSLYKASSRHSNNSSTASSIVNDKDYPPPSRSVGINRMLYNSDDNDYSFVSTDSNFKIGDGSFSVHPVSTATAHNLDASQMQNDSSFGTGDHDDSVTKQSLIYYSGQYEAEDSASAANYSDLNATKISFLVPSADMQHSNYGDFFTMNTDNDDPHYSGSRDVTDESLLRSISYLPEKGGGRPPAPAAAPPHRSDRPPVTLFRSSQPSKNIAASTSRSSRDKYFSDSEVMKDLTSHRGGGVLLKAAPTRQAAEAVSLVHRTTISRPARSSPIPPIASNKMKTPPSQEDYRPHNFTTPVSHHNDVHGGSDAPSSAHQTKGRESSSSPSWYGEAPPSLLPIGSLYTLLSDSSGRPIFVPVMQSPPSALEDSSMLLQGVIKDKGIAAESFPSAPRMEGFSPHADPSLLNRFYYADDDPWMHRRTDGHGSAGGNNRSSRSHAPPAEDRHYLARVLEKALNSSSTGSPTDHHHHRSDDHTFSARRVPPSPVISSTLGTPRSKSPYRLGMSIDGRECLLPSSEYWKDRMAHRSMTSVVNSAAFLRMIT